jgi:hypothetical protein
VIGRERVVSERGETGETESDMQSMHWVDVRALPRREWPGILRYVEQHDTTVRQLVIEKLIECGRQCDQQSTAGDAPARPSDGR